MAAIITNYALCCPKSHWGRPFIPQVVVLGHLLPWDVPRATTALLLSSGIIIIVPELWWGLITTVVHLVVPALTTIIAVLPPGLL
ncbi:MAG: hypothetical protein SVM80_10540 [Halobacteriota archaeon]|nr:hypothetical protein [Halobacteriota archaeon]